MTSQESIFYSDLESIKPILIQDVLLICPGKWNEVEYTKDELKKAFLSTDWNNKSNTHLYLDHQDTQKRGVGNWAGFVKNVRLIGGDLYGDLELWNLQMATYLKAAKAKFGISATLKGLYNEKSNKMENFRYESFSIVTEPACSPAYINLSKDKDLEEKEKEINVTLGKLDLNNIQMKGGLNKKMVLEEKKLDEEAKEEPQAESEEKSEEEVKEEPKEVSESNEAPAEEKSEENLSFKSMKELSGKLDLLSEKFDKLISTFEKSLQSEKAEVVVSEKEDELSKVKKELASLQEKVNMPVSKTLSSATGASNLDANVGMLNYLKGNI